MNKSKTIGKAHHTIFRHSKCHMCAFNLVYPLPSRPGTALTTESMAGHLCDPYRLLLVQFYSSSHQL